MYRTPLILSVAQLACVVAAMASVFGLGAWLALGLAVRGPEVRVPDVVGWALNEATAELEELGIAVEVDDIRLAHQELPANTVLKQDPGAGTPLKRMRTIRLMLASGPVQQTLPTMVGDYATRARIALEQQGMSVDYVAIVHSYEMESDRVIAQEPNPAELAPGTTVPLRLLKSLGAPPAIYVMVDLIGRPLMEVQSFLEARGFEVGSVRSRRLPTLNPGTVVGQSPAAGYQVAAGAEIDLQVSR